MVVGGVGSNVVGIVGKNISQLAANEGTGGGGEYRMWGWVFVW